MHRFSVSSALAIAVSMFTLMLLGCGKPPAEIQKGEEVRRDAVLSYDAAMRKITDALQDGYRQECLAHLATKQSWDIADFERSADAAGKVNVADAKAFLTRFQTAEEAGKNAIGQKLAQQNAALEEARKELLAYLKLDALISEFEAQGLDYTQLMNGAIDIVKGVISKSSTAPPK